jgi:hypothetical protein
MKISLSRVLTLLRIDSNGVRCLVAPESSAQNSAGEKVALSKDAIATGELDLPFW